MPRPTFREAKACHHRRVVSDANERVGVGRQTGSGRGDHMPGVGDCTARVRESCRYTIGLPTPYSPLLRHMTGVAKALHRRDPGTEDRGGARLDPIRVVAGIMVACDDSRAAGARLGRHPSP